MMEAKKKVYGYKYEVIKNDRQINNPPKGVSPGNTSFFNMGKPFKSFSSEKVKTAKVQGNNAKKKRVYTEQIDDKFN